MSGHSKWATIKHQKGATDAKRGKLFSRYSKMVSMAVREGGGDDIAFNAKLRMVVEKAKASNMPKDKIKNAIDKGAGRIAGAQYEVVIYEGFGPSKVAIMIECATDNRNRTNSEIKILMNKNGGVLGSQGSVGYFFDRKGEITIEIPEGKDEDELQLELIDFGVDDMENVGDKKMKLIVEAKETNKISGELDKASYNVIEADVSMVPNSYVELDEKAYEQFMKIFEIIDDYEDVQKTFHNAKKKA